MSDNMKKSESGGGSSNTQLCVCTIIAKNYVPFARVLTDSILQHNPGAQVFVLLVDKVDGHFDPLSEKFRLVTIDELEIPDRDQFLFQYSIIEVCTALKPTFLNYLFNKYGLLKLAYFDPDILITHRLDELSGLLDRYAIILTPHITEPISLEDVHKPHETDFLHVGTYNLGFIALSNQPETIRFLNWWQDRLFKMCIWSDSSRALFLDQKWIDLVPGLFNGVFILRDTSYNVAYWNLQSRRVEFGQGKISVDGQPLKFFHFSGFDPENIDQLSKYQDRFTLQKVIHLKPLFTDYKNRLFDQGYLQMKKWPYAFGCFSNGVKIPDGARKQYLDLGVKGRDFSNPFNTEGRNSYFHWLSQPADNVSGANEITRFWYSVYQSRPDVREAYPDALGKNRGEFLTWCKVSGLHEYCISQAPETTTYKLKQASDNRKSSGHPLLKIWQSSKRLAAKPLEKTFGSDSRPLQALTLVSRGIDILLNEGWRNFWLIFRQWLKQPIPGQKQRSGQLALTADNEKKMSLVTGAIIRDPVLVGHPFHPTGMGEHIRCSWRAFQAAGLSSQICDLYPLESHHDDNIKKELGAHLVQQTSANVNIFHINGDEVETALRSIQNELSGDTYNIIYPLWELSSYPQQWAQQLNRFDEIWAPSRFIFDSISKAVSGPVFHMPLATEVELNHFLNRKDFKLPEHAYLFLYYFDFRSWIDRKNPFGLVNAFEKVRSMRPDADVRLVIKLNRPDGASPWEADYPRFMDAIGRSRYADNIIIIDKIVTDDEIKNLVRCCDCFISLHRSEGFGKGMAEAMYLGKPVIATGYGGNMDFMNEKNACLVSYKLINLQEGQYPYASGQVWAEPDIDHAVKYMIRLLDDREYGNELGKTASNYMRTGFSYQAVGGKYRNRLEQIFQERGVSHEIKE